MRALCRHLLRSAGTAVSKGLLMVVLGLLYCKGEQRVDGSRWIVDSDLYRLLHALDENIPLDPPSSAGSKKGEKRFPTSMDSEELGLAMTPNVDESLEEFVKQDYLMKEKIPEDQRDKFPGAEENAMMYALGPRAALEIGKRQIVHFCGDILDELSVACRSKHGRQLFLLQPDEAIGEVSLP